jgi:AraC-like DNA-binding protein
VFELADSPALFDPDRHHVPALALNIDARNNNAEQPFHHHRKGQLVLAHRGAVTCLVESGVWMVPNGCGVWIPGGMSHSNRVSTNGIITVLFIEPGTAVMPAACCTFTIPPLVRELIAYLAAQPFDYETDSPTGRVAAVLLEQLASMPVEFFHLPMSQNRKIRKIATALLKDPSNRNTIGEWGAHVAMSERSLSRLIAAETGMTFGRWRRQLHIIVALQKLSSGLPVQRVSEDLGYESVNAFITMFKNALGKTPGQYIPRAGR